MQGYHFYHKNKLIIEFKNIINTIKRVRIRNKNTLYRNTKSEKRLECVENRLSELEKLHGLY